MKHTVQETMDTIRHLSRALGRARGDAERFDVLHALLTPLEREEIGLRWRLVQLLHRGLSQRTISAQLGVSLCKITRGSRELKIGRPGFRRLVAREVGPVAPRRPAGQKR